MEPFQLKRLSDHSDESIIREIQRVAALIPAGVITVAEFDRHSRVHTTTLRNRFGGFKEALTAAGLAHRYNAFRQSPGRKMAATTLSDEQLLEELRSVARQLNKGCVTKREFDRISPFYSGALAERFGSWRGALKQAGLRQANLGKRYTEEECFENLLQVWTHHGRPPKHGEMKEPPSVVGPKAYVLRWGTWLKALEAFVNKVNQEEDNPGLPSCDSATKRAGCSWDLEENGRDGNVPDAEKRDIRLGLRYKVLVRDRFKCVACGASPATEPTCRLHVDHIVPFSKGGKTLVENLQVLCERCNLGKGAHLVRNTFPVNSELNNG